MFELFDKTEEKLNVYLEANAIWKTKKAIQIKEGLLTEHSLIHIGRSMQKSAESDLIPIMIYELPANHEDNNSDDKFIGEYYININEFDDYFEPYDKTIRNSYEKMRDYTYKNTMYTARWLGAIALICILVLAGIVLVCLPIIAAPIEQDLLNIMRTIYTVLFITAGVISIITLILYIRYRVIKKKVFKKYSDIYYKSVSNIP